MKLRETQSITLFYFALSLSVLLCSAARSQSPSPTDATNSTITTSALPSTPWYDAGTGSLVPIVVNERIDDSVNRQSRWLPKPKKLAKTTKPATPNTPAANTGAAGTGLFGSGLTIANMFGWLLLALLIAVAVGGIVYAFSKAEIDLGKPKDATKISTDAPDEQMIERMKHLPVELRRTDVNLRTEAERLMGEGQFDQAIILLFGHQLLMLDQAGSLRLTRGKTNGRYVRETRSAVREQGERLRQTVTAFERSYFGRHSISAAEFESLWTNNDDLEKLVQSQREAAA